MKNIFYLILFFSFSSAASMTGHWELVNKNSSFSIELVQSGNHVKGKYCFITNNGNRIDCAEDDDEDNITGIIKNGVADIHFESTFGQVGRAEAVLEHDRIIYSITDKTPFIQANMSVPDKIELSKKADVK